MSGKPAIDKETEAIRLLKEKTVELGRLPKKQDFEDGLAGVIKASLGPWPRALEKAGLKEVSQAYLNRQARQKAKRKQSHRKTDA